MKPLSVSFSATSSVYSRIGYETVLNKCHHRDAPSMDSMAVSRVDRSSLIKESMPTERRLMVKGDGEEEKSLNVAPE